MYIIETNTECFKTVSHIEAKVIAQKLYDENGTQINLSIYDKSKKKKTLLAILTEDQWYSTLEGRNYLCLRN
jgi:hypothetical protein